MEKENCLRVIQTKEGSTYLFSPKGLDSEVDLDLPIGLTLRQRLDEKLDQASAATGIPVVKLRQILESGEPVTWG